MILCMQGTQEGLLPGKPVSECLLPEMVFPLAHLTVSAPSKMGSRVNVLIQTGLDI